jgi:hypothetical protein
MSNLSLRENKDFITAELAKKADSSTVTSGLSAKADTTYVNTELAKKADSSTVTTGLSSKADTSYVNTELAKKASSTHNHSGVYEPVLASDRKRKITISNQDPSGGSDGDIWFKYK